MTDEEILELYEDQPNPLIFARRILQEAAKREPVGWMDGYRNILPTEAMTDAELAGLAGKFVPVFLHPAEPCAKCAEYKDMALDNGLIATKVVEQLRAAEAKCAEYGAAMQNAINTAEEWKKELDLWKGFFHAAESRLSTLRNEVLEEAAKECDKRESELRYYRCDGATEMELVADRIRNLKTKGETK